MSTLRHLAVALVVVGCGLGRAQSGYERLYNTLLTGYNIDIRPTGQSGNNATYILHNPRLYSIVKVRFLELTLIQYCT